MAGATIKKLLVALGLDASEYTSGLDKADQKANKSSSNIVSGLSKIGGAVVIGGLAAAGAGVVALGGFLASTVTPASDLNETISKSQVVFGKYGNWIKDWGTKSATAMGLSENAALGAASTYGNLFRSMGLTELSSYKMSTSLVQLAGDLASFNNLDPGLVLEKLRAGLTGEAEPLKTLGININESILQQKALSLGLIKTLGPLDASTKAQAAYALMMEQSTLAQGDFARTSDGLANQQRIVAANFENIKAKIGTALLPLMTTLTSTVNALFSDPAFLAGMQAFITGIVAVVTQLVTFIGQAVPAIMSFIQGFPEFLQANQGIIIAVLAAIGVAIGAFVFTTVIPAVIALITSMAPVLLVMAAVAAVAYVVYNAWTSNWQGIQEKVQAVLAFVQGIIQSVISWLQSFWAQNGDAILAKAQQVWGTIQSAINSVITFISGLISSALASIQAWWAANGAQIMAFVNSAWSAIQAVIQRVIGIIQTVVSAFQSAMAGDWYAFGQKLRQAWDAAWKLISDIVAKVWPTIRGFLEGAVRSIINFFTTTDWGAVGRGIIDGITAGIKNAAKNLGAAAKQAADDALNAVKGFLGIHSPSRVFAELGGFMMEGMAIGIETNARLPEQAVSDVSRNISQQTNYQNNFNLTAQYQQRPDRDLTTDIRNLAIIYGAGT